MKNIYRRNRKKRKLYAHNPDPVVEETKSFELPKTSTATGTWTGLPKTTTGGPPSLDPKNQKIVDAVTSAIVPDSALEAGLLLTGVGAINRLWKTGSRLYQPAKIVKNIKAISTSSSSS